MNPLIFKKELASSCLVPNKTWDDVIGKPDMFYEMAQRILAMANEAAKVETLSRTTTLKIVKKVIKDVIIDPLTERLQQEDGNTTESDDSNSDREIVYADAFWDEIGSVKDFSHNLREAIDKAYVMKKRINENEPLTDSSTLQETKNLINTAILNPLQGTDNGV